MKIDDDMLSAYLDGELSQEERAAVEAMLAAGPALRARRDALEAATTRFAEAIRAVGRTQTPASVEALLRPNTDNIVAFRKKSGTPSRWPLFAALAATLAVFVITSNFLGGGGQGGRRNALAIAMGPVDRTSPLHRALDATPSAQTAKVGSAEIRPVATFMIAGRAPCREFLATSDERATRAVACRADGQWTVKIAAEETLSAGGYQPASGPSAAIGAFVDAAIAGDPLGPEEEQALIRAKWRAP